LEPVRLPEPELPELSEAELLAVEPFMAQFLARAKATADREFNSRLLSHAGLIAKGKAQATLWAAQAKAAATDAVAAACVVVGPLPLRDSSICPHDGDPVSPGDEFTAFCFDEPGSDN
jgi:hypothetical protein